MIDPNLDVNNPNLEKHDTFCEIGGRLPTPAGGVRPFRMFSNLAPLHFWPLLGTIRERKNAEKNAKIVLLIVPN